MGVIEMLMALIVFLMLPVSILAAMVVYLYWRIR